MKAVIRLDIAVWLETANRSERPREARAVIGMLQTHGLTEIPCEIQLLDGPDGGLLPAAEQPPPALPVAEPPPSPIVESQQQPARRRGRKDG